MICFCAGGLLYDLVGCDGCSTIMLLMRSSMVLLMVNSCTIGSNIDTLIAFAKKMARPTKDGIQVSDMEWAYG